MSSSVDVQDSPQHERGQMGSRSYYKCPQEKPSRQAEEKKDLLMYFTKVARTPVIRKPTESQSKCNSGCEEDDEVIVISPESKTNSDVNKQIKHVCEDGQKTNGLWRSGCTKNNVNQEQSSPDIEIAFGNKNVKVNFDKELNSNLEIDSHSEICHVEILDVNTGSPCKTKEEFQCNHDKSSVSSDKAEEILSATPKKKIEANLLDKVEPKLSGTPKKEMANIFVVMMANRRKQNEILKDLKEKENLNKVDHGGGQILGQSPSKLQECIVITSNSEEEPDLTDEENSCGLGTVLQKKAAGTEDSRSLKLCKSKLFKGNDAFKLMMANRHRLDKQQSPIKNFEENCDQISQVHSTSQDQEKHSVLSKISTSSSKGTSSIKKRKREELDSSFQDFDLSVKKGIKKRKQLKKKSKIIPDASNIDISEMAHLEIEKVSKHGERENNIIRNNSSLVKFPGCSDSLSQSGFEETEEQKTASNCKSVTFTDFMKQALERERVKDSKFAKSEGKVKVDNEMQSINERIKGTYVKDRKDIGNVDKKIIQGRKIKENICDIEKNFYINGTSKVDDVGTDIKKPLVKVVGKGGTGIKKRPGKLVDDGGPDITKLGKVVDKGGANIKKRSGKVVGKGGTGIKKRPGKLVDDGGPDIKKLGKVVDKGGANIKKRSGKVVDKGGTGIKKRPGKLVSDGGPDIKKLGKVVDKGGANIKKRSGKVVDKGGTGIKKRPGKLVDDGGPDIKKLGKVVDRGGANIKKRSGKVVGKGGTGIKKRPGKLVDDGGPDIKKPEKFVDDGGTDVKIPPGKLVGDEGVDIKKPGKGTKCQGSIESHRKRLRQKINCIMDSDDDSRIADMADTPCDQNLGLVSVLKERPCDQNLGPISVLKEGHFSQEDVECCKKSGISQFFKKISKEEKSVERSKNIFTVKADVHAPDNGLEANVDADKGLKNKICDGQHYDTMNVNKENVSDSHSKRCSRRLSKRIKKNQELEDLNKIELLEQIAITASPNKIQASSLRLISSSNVEEHKESELDALEEEDKRSTLPSSCSSIDMIQKENNTKKEADKSSRKVLKASQNQNAIHKMVAKEEKESDLETESSDKVQIKMPVPVSEEKSRTRLSREQDEVQGNVDIEDKSSDKETTVRRSLRRKRSELKEENSGKIFGQNSKGDVINSDFLPLAESICDISSDALLENDATGVVGCTSTKINEDDKENSIKYTSTLVQKPGKLRLKIKRIKHTPQHVKNRRSLSLKQNNTVESRMVQKRSKKLLQKAKGIRKLSEHQKKKKALLDSVAECVDEHAILVNMALVDSDVVVINDTSSFVDDKIKPSKQTKKKKSTQVLLKPLTVDRARKKQGLNKNKVCSKKTRNTNTNFEDAKEGKCNRSQRPSRQAAISAKKALDEQRKIVAAEEGEKKTSKASRKDAVSKDTKLAPIFCKKSKSPSCVEIFKVMLSPSKLKARQDFLQSGVPEEIKKQVFIERSQEEELSNWPPFPEVSHVQQKTDEALWKLGIPEICLQITKHEDYNPTSSVGEQIFPFTTCLSEKINHGSRASLVHMPTLDLDDIASVLANMKSQNPNFPIYKVFKSYYDMKKDAVELYKRELEKERLEEQDIVIIDDDDDTKVKKKCKRKNKAAVLSRSKRSKLGATRGQRDEKVCTQLEAVIPLWHEKTPHSWTQVFAPKNGKHVIGNTEHVRRLKMWLQEWKKKCQAYANKEKSKKKKTFKKEDDSFEESDGSSSWDEDDFVNTYLLCGPPGIGKTAAVYALAAELGYKVLEVNASSRRPGRQVMSQLVEATQSHSVANNSSSQPSNTLAAMFAAKTSGAASRATSLCIREESQESCKDFEKRKDVSLVLFKDIDIVFEEWDDGFLSTVNNFMATSKRPIVLTVNQASPSVFSRIKGTYDKMEFVSPSEDHIAQHLQLVCLANGYHICSKDLESLTNTNKSDIRQSILDLQMLVNSGSSRDLCDCGVREMADTSTSLCENNLDGCRTHDLSLNDVFPEETNIKLKDVKLYKAGVCGKLQATAAFNSIMSALKLDKQLVDSDGAHKIYGDVSWSQVADNLRYLLPFPLKKKVNKVQRYPLCASDPLLRVTNLWQRCSWLSLDEDEDDSQPEVIEEKEEVLEKIEVPQSVQNASKLCLNSFVNLYDTFTQLDILNSSQCSSRPKVQIKEQGWWVQQPTAGLSDDQGCSSPYWAPVEVLNDITHELGHRALIQCNGEISSCLKEVSPRDWPQLCLSSDFRHRVPSLLPHLSPDDSERSSHWELMGSIASSLPPVNQLNRRISLDYFPTLRSICRYDELGAALSKKRRGRRFLSQMAQLGFDISLPDKLKMANAMIT